MCLLVVGDLLIEETSKLRFILDAAKVVIIKVTLLWLFNLGCYHIAVVYVIALTHCHFIHSHFLVGLSVAALVGTVGFLGINAGD
jgi:hypothetical protein